MTQYCFWKELSSLLINEPLWLLWILHDDWLWLITERRIFILNYITICPNFTLYDNYLSRYVHDDTILDSIWKYYLIELKLQTHKPLWAAWTIINKILPHYNTVLHTHTWWLGFFLRLNCSSRLLFTVWILSCLEIQLFSYIGDE